MRADIERFEFDQIIAADVARAVGAGIDGEAAEEKRLVDFKVFAEFAGGAQALAEAVEKPFHWHDLFRRPAVGHVFVFILDVRVGFQQIDGARVLVPKLVGRDRVPLRGILETTVEQNSLPD